MIRAGEGGFLIDGSTLCLALRVRVRRRRLRCWSRSARHTTVGEMAAHRRLNRAKLFHRKYGTRILDTNSPRKRKAATRRFACNFFRQTGRQNGERHIFASLSAAPSCLRANSRSGREQLLLT
jgi:hypothetical protein